jgi:hypothetical protein
MGEAYIRQENLINPPYLLSEYLTLKYPLKGHLLVIVLIPAHYKSGIDIAI